MIKAGAVHCMNFNGTDYWGRPYTPEQEVSVPEGGVVALWVRVLVPSTIAAGSYTGSATVHLATSTTDTTSTASPWTSTNNPLDLVSVVLQVAGPPLKDGGDSSQWRGTRLTWLDSDLGVAGDTVPPPFIPLAVQEAAGAAGFTAVMLDKRVQIGADGQFP
jgi:hypothetical protein